MDTDQLDPLAARCAATCKRGLCTGLGSRSLFAHRCLFTPAPPPPPCELCPAASVSRVSAGGYRCAEHMPPQPSRAPSCVTSPSTTRPAPVYGSATTDPLGREGPGWHKGTQSALPTRDRVGS
jgi:hypothetical protein